MIRWRFIFFYFFLASTLASLVLVPLFRRLALRWNIVDHPGERKVHKAPTPLLGGGAIFTAFAFVTALHYAAHPFVASSAWMADFIPDYYKSYFHGAWAVSDKLLIVMAGAALISILGLFDDAGEHLSIRVRMLFELLIAVVVVSVGLKPHIAVLPEPLTWVLSVVWIVGVTNAMNLLDVADGLSAGVGFIASLLLAWVMTANGQPLIAVFLLVLAGAILGFLRYNFFPARIFMGSWGSLFIGYMLSVAVLLSLDAAPRENLLFPALVPVLILGIPLYDTFSVIAIRVAQGRSIVLADQSHFAHRLMRLGFSMKQAVLFIWLLTLVIGVNAALMPKMDTLHAVILLAQAALLFLLIGGLERVMFVKQQEAEKRAAAGAASPAPSTPPAPMFAPSASLAPERKS